MPLSADVENTKDEFKNFSGWDRLTSGTTFVNMLRWRVVPNASLTHAGG